MQYAEIFIVNINKKYMILNIYIAYYELIQIEGFYNN
ncbi:hypothetical protein CLTEP_04450 [Clostridium tepidiprofundi DSM 19306]|uniref:Uncharacterized protein n=1 Tax=Clostridium tepidiprofundi DSM 19306 TaxID=1121338 RepID=A0A151B6I0_9CLOT|nr:hypothetical protein CLTEP_04450 [Clostridium tepidiprofundi DSM 19306]